MAKAKAPVGGGGEYDDGLASKLIEQYNQLKAVRDSQNMTTWQRISGLFLPQDSNIQIKKIPGQIEGWTDKIFDTTGIEVGETLKAGQYNWLTPPNQPWAEYDLPDEMKQDDEVQDEATKWFSAASDITRRELARSNFHSIASESYLGVGVFGTDLVLAEEGSRKSLNFVHALIGTYVIDENDEGIVDTAMREFEFTYRQVKQKFSQKGDTLPDKFERDAGKPESKNRRYKILHCVYPRQDSERDPERKDGANKPIASVYILIDYKAVIRTGGYEESPILCQRFDKWGSETPWGYGPAYLGLTLASQLNYVQQNLDALAELLVNPRVLIPDNLTGVVDLRAGGVTTTDSSKGKEAWPQEWAAAGEYKLGLDLQEQKRKQLREIFLVNAFKLLNSEPLIDKEMTAFEISQRQAENLASFTPSLGRRVTEWINPLMLRVFGILYRQGKFGQPPDSLLTDAGNGKKGLVMPAVLITNRLTDALKALKNRATEQTFAFVLPMIETHPELLDNFQMDDLVRDYAENAGISGDLLRNRKGKDSTDSIRAARAQVAAQQRNAALTEQAASAGKNLAQSPEWLQRQVMTKALGRGGQAA